MIRRLTDRLCGLCFPWGWQHGEWWCPSYVADWLLLVAVGIGTLLEYLFWAVNPRPFQAAPLVGGQFAFNDNSHQFPIRSETFNMIVTPCVSVLIPIGAFLLLHFMRRFGPRRERSLHDLHHACLGLGSALDIAYFMWVPITKTTGQFRPDYWYVLQSGDPRDIAMARQSFPSGHAVIAFAGFGYLALWLCGKLRVYHSARGNGWRFVVAVGMPIAFATAIACSRVADNRHSSVDILAGAVLGGWAAVAGYLLVYPPPYAPDCQLPKNRKLGHPTQFLSGVPLQSPSHTA